MKRALHVLCSWVFGAVLCGVAACRVHDGGNPAFHDGACATRSYRGFCVAPDGGPLPSGQDAAADAGHAKSRPSTEGEPCAPLDDEKLCYDGALSTQGVGACRSGVEKCAGGRWSECVGQVMPAAERCNGDDDDCDGEVDEDTRARCVAADTGCTGELVCKKGKPSCSAPDPEPEACNGRDDDCDGDTDEDADRPCVDDNAGCSDAAGAILCQGVCTAGVRHCAGGELGACVDQVKPHGERCDTGAIAFDDDCDGEVDEDCGCTLGGKRACYAAAADPRTGATCQPGTQQCKGGTWGACTGADKPRAEQCPPDGVDDDCNGTIDDVKGRGDDCVTTRPGRCHRGTRVCRDAQLVCEAPSAIEETCNEIDDDCDGHTDEGYDLKNDRDHCGECGNKCGDDRECCDGACVDLSSNHDHCSMCGTSCGADEKCCDSTCTAPVFDPANCGACGHACGPTDACCNGECVDILSDEDDCGGCNAPCDAATQTCIEGTCSPS
jgi:hypothetical protein